MKIIRFLGLAYIYVVGGGLLIFGISQICLWVTPEPHAPKPVTSMWVEPIPYHEYLRNYQQPESSGAAIYTEPKDRCGSPEIINFNARECAEGKI